MIRLPVVLLVVSFVCLERRAVQVITFVRSNFNFFSMHGASEWHNGKEEVIVSVGGYHRFLRTSWSHIIAVPSWCRPNTKVASLDSC